MVHTVAVADIMSIIIYICVCICVVIYKYKFLKKNANLICVDC